MSSTTDQLTNTSYVLLGFLNAHPHSGYDIKRIADHSTRFFWQISYGQIYPELKRLVDLGLAAQEPGSRGGRTRNVYRITAKGRLALRSWLAGSTPSAGSFEMRDELLLKLFFSDAGGPKVKRAIVEQMRLREVAAIAELRSLEPHARDTTASHGASKMDVLLGGIKLHETYLSHLEELQKNLT
jgi:DNA-binding PadR family transcriptional regulator